MVQRYSAVDSEQRMDRGRAVKDKATTEETGSSMSSGVGADGREAGGRGTRDGALPPVIIEFITLATMVRGQWWWRVYRDTQNMLETLYLSMCLQRGPNSPPEPINLEE